MDLPKEKNKNIDSDKSINDLINQSIENTLQEIYSSNKKSNFIPNWRESYLRDLIQEDSVYMENENA
jgi:hypothetical protein